ncbi:MAG: hypothetical protein WEG40_16750 [Candidatus Rokuibacteriota bacterium]
MPQPSASSPSVARRFARFVSGVSLDTVPSPVVAQARLLAPDTLGSCLAVRLTDGRRIEERQDHPRGGPDFPMTREELTARFRANAAEAVPEAQAARVMALVDALAAQPRVTALMDALTA